MSKSDRYMSLTTRLGLVSFIGFFVSIILGLFGLDVLALIVGVIFTGSGLACIIGIIVTYKADQAESAELLRHLR
jgi:dolichol kinase